jgi:signal transduction histidine kinase
MGLSAALSRDRVRISFACVGAAALGVYFLMPADSAAESTIYQLFSASAAILLLVRALRTRGRDRLGWLCFAGGIFCFAAGDFVWVVYTFFTSSEMPYPSIADVFYLAGYPFLALGTFFAFSGREGRSLGSFLEASIVTCASGLLIWLIVVEPTGQAHGASLLVRLTGAAYPTMDFVLLGALSQSLFRGRRRGSLLAMVAAALMLQTVADLLYARLTLSGLYNSGNWLDAGWMVSYLVWGFAALSRQGQERTKAVPTSAGVSWLPLGLMFLALLCPPLTLMVETAWHRPLDLKSVISAWLVIAGLVFARLVLLIRELVATQGIRQQQTEALRVQNALLEANERERTRLLARTSEVAEQERMRIAAELHDGPIQKLTVVAFKLDRLERRIARDEHGVEPLIREIRDQLEIEMSSLRRVMSELRPPILDERNLEAALNDCAEQVLADAPIAHKTTCDLGPEAPAPEVETAVYRVVREALMNVRKHASATRVDVEVARRGECMHLLIVDDGAGFDDDAPAGHFGLLGMEERIGSVGGIFAVTSALGTGTRIEATLPWKPRVSAHPDASGLPSPALA